MKKILVMLLTLMLITGCSKPKEQLIMATEAGFEPYEYYENGEVVGVDVDIASAIANYLGKELVIKDVAFDSIINEVKTGKSDIGVAGISYDEERALQVDFSLDYVTSKQVIVVKKESVDVDIYSFYGRKVAVQLGSVADTYIADNHIGIELVREKKFLAAIQDLKDGKVDAVVMDEIPAKSILMKNPELKILDNHVVEDSYGIVVQKGNDELLNAVNHVITDLKEDGKIDEFVINHSNRDPELKAKSGIWNSIYQTLIIDDRYELILQGLVNTIIIALFAVLMGTIIGVIIALIRNNYEVNGKIKLLNDICKLYVGIIRGTPVILQLMIIYYVIFKSVDVNIVFVSIIAFGINSGAYVSEIIRAGINSIPKGQLEAGYALGLGYSKVMSKIVLPQAVKNILPALGNEFIMLIKETAVGAYIGVVELTKASDIIASRTYDYFFPLIVVAIIYLCLTTVLSKLVNKLERRLNKNVRS